MKQKLLKQEFPPFCALFSVLLEFVSQVDVSALFSLSWEVAGGSMCFGFCSHRTRTFVFGKDLVGNFCFEEEMSRNKSCMHSSKPLASGSFS